MFNLVLINLFITIIYLFFGFITGILSSLTGIGGGLFIVPTIIATDEWTNYNIIIQNAIGTSSIIILFVSISATFVYLRKKIVDIRLGLLSSIITIPFAFIGSILTSFLSSNYMSVIFGLLLLLISFKFMSTRINLFNFKFSALNNGSKRKITDISGNTYSYNVNFRYVFIFMIITGLLSGFLGIGGGVIIVPLYRLLFKIPIKIAVATSLFIMMFTSTGASLGHFLLGNIVFEIFILMLIGIIIGTQIGTRLLTNLNVKYLEPMLGLLFFIIGLILIYNNLLSL